jgi:hypothetical protein
MSYDLTIGDFCGNYTYNLAPLFFEIIPGEVGGLRELHGMTGKQAGAVLSLAFERLDRMRFRNGSTEADLIARFDAPNGWGTTFGATIFLAQVMAACLLNPRRKVRVT